MSGPAETSPNEPMPLLDEYPRVLHVDTTYSDLGSCQTQVWQHTLDYHLYEHVPAWWRALERFCRFDWVLAIEAARIADQYDVVLAGSERVGIPLALMRIRTPLVTLVYNIASPVKRRIMKWLGIPRQWHRVGYLTPADREFMASYFAYPENRLFRYVAAPLDRIDPATEAGTGPIVTAGVSKRDYATLMVALRQLPGYELEIFATSRYRDRYKGALDETRPEGIQFKEFVPPEVMAEHYRKARFVVLPLHDTYQFSAGFTVALEAHAAGKAVIATATRGMSDYIQPGVTGLLVPPYNPDALRDAIRHLWEHPDEAAAMGTAGRRLVEREFDPDDATRQARQVLWQVHRDHLVSISRSGDV